MESRGERRRMRLALLAGLALALIALLGAASWCLQYMSAARVAGRASLYASMEEALSLTGAPALLNETRRSLEGAACRADFLGESNPWKVVLLSREFQSYGETADRLNTFLSILYAARGERMPPELAGSLARIGDYLALTGQNLYESLYSNGTSRPLTCSDLPGPGEAGLLRRALWSLATELRDQASSGRFTGVSNETIELLAQAARGLPG